jgi:hypothetical protein
MVAPGGTRFRLFFKGIWLLPKRTHFKLLLGGIWLIPRGTRFRLLTWELFPRGIVPLGTHWLALGGIPLGNDLNCVPPRNNHVPTRSKCNELCVIITFAFKFWLKCFLQSCSFIWDLSNERLQVYIYKEMIVKAKRFGTYVSSGNLGFSRGKFIVSWGTIMSLGRRSFISL